MLNVLDTLGVLHKLHTGSGQPITTVSDVFAEAGDGVQLNPASPSSMNTLYDQSGITPTIPDDLGEAIGYVEGRS